MTDYQKEQRNRVRWNLRTKRGRTVESVAHLNTKLLSDMQIDVQMIASSLAIRKPKKKEKST